MNEIYNQRGKNDFYLVSLLSCKDRKSREVKWLAQSNTTILERTDICSYFSYSTAISPTADVTKL